MLFGFFMALLVLLNYLMVISMFPAGIVIYHYWLEERTWKGGLRWKKGPGGAGEGRAAAAPDSSAGGTAPSAVEPAPARGSDAPAGPGVQPPGHQDGRGRRAAR